MSQKSEVIIIGGGVVGLTAALAMAQRQYRVALLDSKQFVVDTSSIDARVYAINKASQSLLQELGVWPLLASQRVSTYHKMHVWDGVNGAEIDFDSRFIAENKLGYIIEESILKQALLARVADYPQLSLHADCTVEAVEIVPDGISISTNQETWQGQLLIAADGAHSITRELLQVPLTTWSYQQKATVVTVATEKPHQHTAYQVFNPEGPLAFLPLSHPQHCSIVWSTDTNRAEALMDLDDEQFSKELAKAFAHTLGAVEVISKRYQFPLIMRHVNQYSGSRWLLVGDAAHTIHPLAGLGLNLGLADVSSWMQCLKDYPAPSFSKRQLAAYQRQRKHAVWQTIMLMEGFKHLFSATALPITSLRGLGLRACNALTPLKRLFIEHAAG